MKTPNDDSKEPAVELSPKDLEDWLRQENLDATKALELKLSEATEFVRGYSAGQLSAEEVAERLFEYENRWGEPLHGVHVTQGLTNADLLSAIDRARDEADGRSRGRLVRREGRGPGR